MQRADKLVQRYLESQAKAKAAAERTFTGIGVGRRRRPAPKRGRARWTESMVQGGDTAAGVGGRRPIRVSRGGPTNRGIGQASTMSQPRGGDVLVFPGDDGGYYPEGHPKCPIDNAGPPTTMDCDSPQPCGVNAIGGNTLGTAGIVPGAIVPLIITAGDAGKYTPKAVYFEGQPYSSNDLIDPALLPAGRADMPILLVDALVGRISMLRRGGAANVALTQGGFANTKELVAVDWGTFVSTNEQNLNLLFLNPNVGVTLHAFADLWGDI